MCQSTLPWSPSPDGLSSTADIPITCSNPQILPHYLTAEEAIVKLLVATTYSPNEPSMTLTLGGLTNTTHSNSSLRSFSWAQRVEYNWTTGKLVSFD